MKVDHYQDLVDRGWRRSVASVQSLRGTNESPKVLMFRSTQLRLLVLQARLASVMLPSLHNTVTMSGSSVTFCVIDVSQA